MHGDMILFLFSRSFVIGWIPNWPFITLLWDGTSVLGGLMLPPLFNICVLGKVQGGTGYWRLWKRYNNNIYRHGWLCATELILV
jgi:hypothetical protein